ncbi:MAG: superoxide dismutase [Patescibacteria group bacterium]|jgi:Fe-Mn family superoxide dismutase|nr:superoxide dismutase [Patescibacteria group bacterium]
MHTLNTLDYELNALEPFMSSSTLEFHYGKHHQGYVNKLNNLIEGTEMEEMSLEDIIKNSFDKDGKEALFNNSAQVFNHNLFWKILTNNDNSSLEDISSELKTDIEESFESSENMLAEFKKTALSQFGSGWTWLVIDEGKIKIEKTSNANNPLIKNQKPLLCVDVWEHSYYLDYQNKRAEYLDNVLNNIINWKYVSKLYKEYK